MTIPYRNVYEERDRIVRNLHPNEEPEKDPKKIAEIYKSQIAPVAPGTDEFKRKQAMLTRTNLTAPPGREYNAARDGKFDRGIRKSLASKTQNRSR